MKLQCPSCHRDLEFSADRPSFCAYCGCALGQRNSENTVDFVPTKGPSTVDYVPGSAALSHSDRPVNTPGAAPSILADYRLLRHLGTGGMGTVYEAEQITSGRHVALKLISPKFAASPEAVDRFRQEGRLASLVVHPRCVFVLAADESAGQPYIVMELMPGKTLQDLVQQRGRLPVEEAVAKILDIIEGLQEAHRLGVIHRDVKPSNCFIDADGRIKVGDFGLAKSLIADQHLTRTGSFLGTALYASPEQIKAETVDQQTDVYSVAATLYFLLTGRAPFESRDAAATIARIVSDSPPPLRSLRPEIPATLDKIVLRGLERQRPRRWRNLDELKAALLPFVSSHLAISSAALRVGAFLIDCGLVLPLILAEAVLTNHFWRAPDPLRVLLLGTLPWIVYFLILETLWGCSLGKRWLGLRIFSASGNHTPGLQTVLLRTLVFYALVGLPADLLSFAYYFQTAQQTHFLAYGLVSILGVLVTVAPMRARNGYRGIHELLSGTRVVRLRWSANRRAFQGHTLKQMVFKSDNLPERVGSYQIQGALSWTAESSILVGQETALERKVWIYLRPIDRAPLSAARRELHRPSRLPWLACGTHAEMQWDAFLAPSGCPLPAAIQAEGRLFWPEARSILEQLAEEVAAACRDQTLPRSMSVDQVWIQANGRIQLIEPSLDYFSNAADPSEAPDQQAAWLLLREVTQLTLEGVVRPAKAAPAPIRAPLPKHAAARLNRLLLVENPFATIEQFRDDLAADQEEPPEVSAAHRAAHLALLTTALFPPLVLIFFVPCLFLVMMRPGLIEALNLQLGEERRILSDLEDGMWRDWVFSQAQPEPFLKVYGWLRFHGDKHLQASLQQKVANESGLAKVLLQAAGPGADSLQKLHLAISPARSADFRMAAAEAIQAESWVQPFMAAATASVIVFVLSLPLIWVLWVFLLQGGFTYRLAGIALLRSDGCRTTRMQCAWRALLVWAPVAGLLAASVWVGGMGFQAWLQQSWALFEWLYGLSWTLWGFALALLPLYVGLALWLPNRSLHDRLAGTYLVPR